MKADDYSDHFPMYATVIIPTHRRPELLEWTVQAIFSQNPLYLRETEVLVLSDGYDEESLKAMKRMRDRAPCRFGFGHESKSGRAAVRNAAARMATGEILIFIGDDIIVTPHWLETHLTFHRRHPQLTHAMVGHITWHPELPVSRYMRWLENGGPLLDFRGLHEGDETNFKRFYTGNISLKRELFLRESFQEAFDMYGWEDTELASRLSKKHNLRIFYSSRALAYHYHIYEEERLASYSEQMGYSAYRFQEANPDFHILPGFMKQLVFRVLAALLPILRRAPREWYWYAFYKKHFLLGMRSAHEHTRRTQ